MRHLYLQWFRAILRNQIGAKVVAVLGIVVALSSCSSVSGESAAQASAEFRTEAHRLSLPSGDTWPLVPEKSTAADGRPQRYEAGVGTEDADFWWLCSWATYLSVQVEGSAPAAKAAVQMQRLRTLYLYTTGADVPTRQHFDSVLNSVVGGAESTQLRALVQDGCPSQLSSPHG